MDNYYQTQQPKQKLGWVPFAIGGASFIPLLGVPFGLIAIVWGLVKAKAGGLKLVILGGCGVLFTVGLYGTLFYKGFIQEGGVFDELRTQMAQGLVNDLIKRIEYYKVETGEYPQTLSELQPHKQNSPSFFSIHEPFVRLNNPTPRPFNYGPVNQGNNYYLFSSGPDGKPGTDDDIHPHVPEDRMDRLGYRVVSNPNEVVPSNASL
jgi:hypothetical protein